MKNTRTASGLALCTGIISMSLGGSIVCASTVPLGTLTPFTGGDAGEGLDLSGTIIYAFNLGGPDQTVQGVNFVAASVGGPPAGIAPSGGTLQFDYSNANPAGANGTDYGASTDDDALEGVVNSVWYNGNWTFDLAVVPGNQYELQLILQESFFNLQGQPGRNFDISVGTVPAPLTLAVDELVLGLETNGANTPGADAGLVYTYSFTATDSSFRVALDDNPLELGDGNAVLAAVTLKELGDDATPPGISTLDPIDQAMGVPTISDLMVTFDESVVFGTGNITIRESVGNAVVEAFDVATSLNLLLSGASVTVNPSSDLAGTTGYYVEIDPEAIDDTSGNSFVGITGPGTWSFATASADVTEPAVGAVDSPANGATDVSPGDSLALTFDEEVQKGAGTIVIRRTDDDTVVDTIDVTTSAVTVSGAQITIVPNFPLPALTSLYVEIDAGAFQDLVGNPFAGISGSGTWSFTTADTVLTPFTGGDAGEGLDLSGNIIYAFNLGGTDQTVQGVNFVATAVGIPPAGIAPGGGTLEFDYATANPGGANGADYGPSADDDALESIVNTVWYNSNWTFDLDVVPGTEYQLQLIFQESFLPLQGVPARNFDVSLGSPALPLTLVIDDFAQGLVTNGASQPGDDFGMVYSYTFTATDSPLRVALDDNPLEIGDGNAVLAAVTLEELSMETLALRITGNGANLDFEWESNPGMFYVLRSSTDLAADLSTWDSVNVPGSVENNGVFEIATTPAVNMHTIPRPGDPTRFYRVQEISLPPVTVLEENFDTTTAGNLPADWTTGFDAADTLMNTAWELGDPTGGPISGPNLAFSGANCVGTNLLSNYGLSSNTWLRTPAIDLSTATGATVTFQHWVDIDDFLIEEEGTVRVLDAATPPGAVTELEVVSMNISGANSNGWVEFTAELTEASLGESVALEFIFRSDATDDGFDLSGWYIDDVTVTTPAP